MNKNQGKGNDSPLGLKYFWSDSWKKYGKYMGGNVISLLYIFMKYQQLLI